jgi:hypothetical protein
MASADSSDCTGRLFSPFYFDRGDAPPFGRGRLMPAPQIRFS